MANGQGTVIQQDLREMMLCQQSRCNSASRIETRRSNVAVMGSYILITGIRTILEVEDGFDVYQCVLGRGRARPIRLGTVGREGR